MAVDTTFGSDNHSGVHPRVLEAIAAANSGPAVAYGLDAHTEAAVAKFREHFGKNSRRLHGLQRHRGQRHQHLHPGALVPTP